MDNEEFLSRNRRFVAYMDVLGYCSIASDTILDQRKAVRFHSLFQALGIAVTQALRDCSDPEPVKAICFSDSFYFSGKDLPGLLSFLEQVFTGAYAFQGSSYDKDSDDWVPFVRSAVVQGWAVYFRDPTLPTLPEPEVFRNPVGPAVVEVYNLAEKRIKLPGMRCFMERGLLNQCSPTWVDTPPHYKITSGERELRLLDVPITPNLKEQNLELVELAWPCRVISSDPSFFSPLDKCKSQFSVGTNDEKSQRVKHYNATVELFRQSVLIGDDRNAPIMWDRMSGDLTLNANPERTT